MKTTVARVSVARDPCVVSTPPLRSMLQEFVTDWNRTRPPIGGQFCGDHRPLTPVGAVSWLAAETHLPRRTIRRVLSGTQQVTELRVAEALVHAIGREYELSPLTGSLEIRQNRNAKGRCCSTAEVAGAPRTFRREPPTTGAGSLNGSFS